MTLEVGAVSVDAWVVWTVVRGQAEKDPGVEFTAERVASYLLAAGRRGWTSGSQTGRAVKAGAAIRELEAAGAVRRVGSSSSYRVRPAA